jgi:PhnB protein
MATVNVYLCFDGACEAAFNFYRSVFGGEFINLSRYGDLPNTYDPVSEADKNKILHIGLPISEETKLLGADMTHRSLEAGNNFSICITAASEEEAHRLYDRLSSGGNVTMPLEQTFWGSLFGMCTDQFGVNWMIDYTLANK